MLSIERNSIASELTPAFLIDNAESLDSPLVFCSPHSGRVYPQSFLDQSSLDATALRKSEDCFVDRLFAPAAEAVGAPLLRALFPRAYLDVNREPYELDARLIEDPLPDFANPHTPRVIGGLGTIARIVADGEEIYHQPIPLEVALERIALLYKPFHRALGELLDARIAKFGACVLIDCHSMPSASMLGSRDTRPDIVLGDRFGISCDSTIPAILSTNLESMGYSVQANRPYAGGFITEHYGRPSSGCHVIQIEINRGLYLDELTLEPTLGFSRLMNDLTVVAHAIRDQWQSLVCCGRAAAE